MSKFQDMLKDRMFVRYGVFILFTATMLYIIYLVLTNISFLAGLAVGALSSLSSALAPLIIGLILAYMINPLVSIIETRVSGKLIRIPSKPEKAVKADRQRRLLSVLLSYVIIIAFVVLLLYAVASVLIGKLVFNLSLPDIYSEFNRYLTTYEETIRQWVKDLPQGILAEQFNDLIQTLIQWVTDNLSTEAAMGFISGVGVSVVNIIIGIMVSIYLSIDKDFFIRLWNRAVSMLLSERRGLAVNRTLKEVNLITSKFLRGVLLDALIVGILASIGLLLAGQKFALFLGLFAGICNIIPYFGPIIAMVPAFIIGLFTDNIWQGVIAVAILILVQQIDVALIYPRVVGGSTGLHPLFVLLAVSIGGFYFGLLGMILAVPIAGIIQIFIHRWVAAKEEVQDVAIKTPTSHQPDPPK